jgi:GNAT superfamily N-acetyltransferase
MPAGGRQENRLPQAHTVPGVMDIAALRAAYDEQLRVESPNPPAGVSYQRDGPVLRVVGHFRGFISAPRDAGVRGAELDRLIARQRDYFARRGEAVEWKTRGHDEPADLPARLLAAGFVPEETETVLVGLAAELAAEPVLPAGVSIRQVEGDAGLRRVAALKSATGDGDWGWLAGDLAGRIAAAPEEIAVFTAQADGEVVSAGWVTYLPGTDFAGLWGGSTLPGWRRQGIYRALVAVRAGHAAARGVPYLQVDALDTSAPILRRLGFQAITTTTPYVWSPGGGGGS